MSSNTVPRPVSRGRTETAGAWIARAVLALCVLGHGLAQAAPTPRTVETVGEIVRAAGDEQIRFVDLPGWSRSAC